MLAPRRLLRIDDPVAVDLFGKGIERAEERVRHRHGPDGSADRRPSGDPLRALDDDVLTGGGLVRDASLIADPATLRRHPLAILAGMDHDRVARLRDGGGSID